MKISAKVERVAQRLYDIRDEVPVADKRACLAIDRLATKISKLAGTLQRREQSNG